LIQVHSKIERFKSVFSDPSENQPAASYKQIQEKEKEILKLEAVVRCNIEEKAFST